MPTAFQPDIPKEAVEVFEFHVGHNLKMHPVLRCVTPLNHDVKEPRLRILRRFPKGFPLYALVNVPTIATLLKILSQNLHFPLVATLFVCSHLHSSDGCAVFP